MATDEKRRLIYELLVQARDAAKDIGAVKGHVEDLGGAFKKLQGLAKASFAGFAVIQVARFMADAVDQATKLNEQLRALGVSATGAAAGVEQVQNIAFATGQSVTEVAEVYKNATEATQNLGGSQEDAIELTKAFTRAAVAEGKAVSVAAAQLETLNFSYERGSVKVKEFSMLLKENETFQKAAEAAMGKTTEQLIAMAKEGEITRGNLRTILDEFKRMAAQKEVAATIGRIATSLVTLAQTYVSALAEASGLNAIFGDQETMDAYINGFRRLAQVVGGVVRILANMAQVLIDTVRLFAQIIADPTNIRKITANWWREFKQQSVDVAAGVQSIQEGFTGEGPVHKLSKVRKTHSEIAAEANARAQAEKDAADAVEREKAAKEAKARAEREAEREREQQADLKRMRERAEQEKKNADALMPLLQSGPQLTADQVEEMDKLLATYREQNEWLAMNESVLRQEARDTEAWYEQHREGLEMLADATDVVAEAFYNLFTGATNSARDFFREILKGMAQIFAAKLSQQIGNQLFDFAQTLIPGYKKKAKGDAFMGGNVVPFSAGGVVGGPTTFPMAGGRIGLMGEAGAEAVMPLRRMRDGKLGVASAAPNVSIINNTGVAASGRASMQSDRMQIVLEAANMGARMAEGRINRSLRTGYGDTAQVMKGAYGLPRRF